MNGALMSGGPIAHFAGAWAKFPFVGSRAHYWTETTSYWRSQMLLPEGLRTFDGACGARGEVTERAPALEMGNWPKCKRCEAALRGAA
jgi:hypothetical protein